MDSWVVSFRYIAQQLPDLMLAGRITLQASVLGAVLAFLWGLLLTVPRMSPSPLARRVVCGYIAVMRYTPLLVQMYLLYFGLPLVGVMLSGLTCGVLALMLQHGAFLAEVFRAAIQAVPEGQWLGGRSIGLRGGQVVVRIILPQALSKAMIPLGNEMVLLAKDTSLLAAIGVAELTLTGKMIAERSGGTAAVFVAIGLLYLVLTTLIGIAARVFEYATRPKE
jgi:polar amino acid transport system permease protein